MPRQQTLKLLKSAYGVGQQMAVDYYERGVRSLEVLLYLPCISPVSPLYLPCISPVSRLQEYGAWRSFST